MSLFDIAKLEQELSELEEKTANSEFWTTNNEETKKVLSEIKRIKSKVIKYRELEKEINDSLELSEMIKESFIVKEERSEVHAVWISRLKRWFWKNRTLTRFSRF